MSTLLIIFIGLQILFALFIFFLTIAFITGAPFVPSTSDVADTMIRMAGLSKGDTVYDLGSGDGRLLFLAAARGANAVGFEINPFLVIFTRIKARMYQYGNCIRVYCRNFWLEDVSGADVVFIYLIPWRMERLRKKLERELKPGSLVVSNSFIFRGWKILDEDPKNHVYAFRIGSK